MARRYTKAEMRAFARDRLGLNDDGPAPMERVGERPANFEVLRVGNESRLLEHVPARLEITEVAKSQGGPFRVFITDDFDTDFQGSGGTEHYTWAGVMHEVHTLAPGYRLYVDDKTGACILRAVHHPATTIGY